MVGMDRLSRNPSNHLQDQFRASLYMQMVFAAKKAAPWDGLSFSFETIPYSAVAFSAFFLRVFAGLASSAGAAETDAS